jgi:alpha-tubulin suppressor-like RCC1 family protein
MCRYGQLGDGTKGTDRLSPVQVRTSVTPTYLSGATQIAAGESHTCVYMGAAGKFRCWGSNANGQLGDGTNTERLYAPSGDLTATGIRSIVVGRMGLGHTCGPTGGNNVMCWGSDQKGQLGTSGGDKLVPTTSGNLGGGSAVTLMCAGWGHTYAMRTTTSTRATGFNLYGQVLIFCCNVLDVLWFACYGVSPMCMCMRYRYYCCSWASAVQLT